MSEARPFAVGMPIRSLACLLATRQLHQLPTVFRLRRSPRNSLSSLAPARKRENLSRPCEDRRRLTAAGIQSTSLCSCSCFNDKPCGTDVRGHLARIQHAASIIWIIIIIRDGSTNFATIVSTLLSRRVVFTRRFLCIYASGWQRFCCKLSTNTPHERLDVMFRFFAHFSFRRFRQVSVRFS